MLEIYAIVQCMIYPFPSEAANSCWVAREYGLYTTADQCKKIEDHIQDTAGGKQASGLVIKFQCVSKTTPAWKPVE